MFCKAREKKILDIELFKPCLEHIPDVNRSTFHCSSCDTKNLDRVSLIEHYEEMHKSSSWGVCPICKVLPWGDVDYETVVLRHLKRRHTFDLDGHVNFDYDEETMLNLVIMNSIAMAEHNNGANSVSGHNDGTNSLSVHNIIVNSVSDHSNGTNSVPDHNNETNSVSNNQQSNE